MSENKQKIFLKFKKTKVPTGYDAVMYHIEPGAEADIYPVDGSEDERGPKRGKLEPKEGLGLSKGDKIEVLNGVVYVKVPLAPSPLKLSAGFEGKVSDFNDRQPRKRPTSTLEKIGKGLAFVHSAIARDPRDSSKSFTHDSGASSGAAGVRGENTIKIKAGDLRALIREAAKRRPSGWLPATEKNLNLDKPFTADSWITNQTGVPVNVLVKNYLKSMGMLEEDDE